MNFKKLTFINKIIFLIHDILENKFAIGTTLNFKSEVIIKSLPLNDA